MTDKEKLKKIKKLADTMYYAAQYLTTDASRLHKAMDEYHQFIINEYHKEEPKFKTGDRIKPIDSCLGSPRTIVDVCDSWYETDQGTLDFEYEDNWELVEESVSKIWHDMSDEAENGRNTIIIDPKGFYGAVLRKGGSQLRNHNKERYVKWAYIDDIINITNKEEPVSEELEEASKNYALNNTPWDDCKDEIQESFKAGANWQETKDESTTEDLGEYINELSKQFPEVSFAKLSRIAVRVAKWQMAQMMANAINVEVKVDAGGYPYIPQIELYDYDKDIPLAKEGDKYNVVLNKEG